MCGRIHTWAAGSELTDVTHGIVSTKRMRRGPREGKLVRCLDEYVESSMRVIVTVRGPCWAGPNV